MAAKGDKNADTLLNDSMNGMLRNVIEIASTALIYLVNERMPSYFIDNFLLSNESILPLEDFPTQSGSLIRGNEIVELGIPSKAYVWVALPASGGLRSVFRGYWPLPRAERHFDTNALWGPLKSHSLLASRVVVRS